MTHVVERCPNCGVEHDVSAAACEACHQPLRYWCRRHGRDAGWLAGPDCPRCAEDAAHPAPPLRSPPGVAAERTVLRGLGPPPADAAVPAPAPPPPRPGHREDLAGALLAGLLVLLLGAAGGAITGFVAAGIYIFTSGRGSASETLLEWGMMGALTGFVIAFLLDALAFFGNQAPPRE
jgi:rRNA maturation protein Nop10